MTEVDNVILDILGKETPTVIGMNIPEANGNQLQEAENVRLSSFGFNVLGGVLS